MADHVNVCDRDVCDRITCKGCIQITSGLRGYFAVMLVPAPDDCWCMPEMSGIGSYKTPDGARAEAQDWAEAEELPYMGG